MFELIQVKITNIICIKLARQLEMLCRRSLLSYTWFEFIATSDTSKFVSGTIFHILAAKTFNDFTAFAFIVVKYVFVRRCRFFL